MKKILALGLLTLAACSADSITAPLPAGSVAVYFAFPNQQLSVDGAGDQADIEQITLSLGTPTLVGGACPSLCPAAATSSQVLSLTPGQKKAWATWTNASGSYTRLRIPVTLRTSATGDLRTGTSVSFGGVFDGVAATQGQYFGAYLTQLPITTTLDLALPSGSAAGSRYTVNLVTDALLRDPDTDRLIDIPDLVGNPSAAALLAVQTRLQTAFAVTRSN